MREHQQKIMVVVDAVGRPQGYLDRDVVASRSGTAADHRAALPATVRVEDDLRTAVSRMFMHDVRWMACVDREGVFAGFVSQRGITRLLGETYRDPTKRAN
jgi:osmoprotectant transport system ATP-binding protein